MFSLKKVLAAGTVAAGLLGFAISPASAAGVGVGVFVGEAVIGGSNGGFGYPVGLCGPGGTPAVCAPDSGTWSLQSIAGAGVAADSSGTAVAGLMDISGGGSVGAGAVLPGAYCGASGGVHDGVSDITVTSAVGDGSITSHAVNIGWLQSAATVIVFENVQNPGTGPVVAGVVSAIPPLPIPGGPSCVNKTATTFTVVGASALVQP